MVTWSSEHAERWCPGSYTLNPLLPPLGMRTAWSLLGVPSSSSSPGLSCALAQADLPLQQSSAWLLLELEKQLLNVEQKNHVGLWHEGTSPAGSTPRGCEIGWAEQQEQKGRRPSRS